MSSRNIYSKLFSESGCLSRKAIADFIDGKLDRDSKRMVEKHAKKCHICSDALAGAKFFASGRNFNRSVGQIRSTAWRRSAGNQVFSKRSLVSVTSVAATVILLVGIFLVLQIRNTIVSDDQQVAQNTKSEIFNLIDFVPDRKVIVTVEEDPIPEYEVELLEEVSVEELVVEEEQKPEITSGIQSEDLTKNSKEPQEENSELPEVSVKKIGTEEVDLIPITSKETSLPSDHFVFGNSRRKSYSQRTFYKVEEPPYFWITGYKNFRDWVEHHIEYPKEAIDRGVGGRVIVSFVVDATGKVDQVKIDRSVDPFLDQEAIRVVKNSPFWHPGMQQGRPVSVRMAVPVCFEYRD